MNGSKITGLAAGTAASDAVNKGQLDAAIASIGGGGGGGSPYLAINASGTAASATQTNSIAMGSAAAAQGVNSMAMGVGANVTSESGTAIGSDSAADSDAIGARAEFYATAVGTDANAGGTAATTVGAAARSAGSYATSIGYASYAGGVGSTAIGTNAYALRTGSVAIGLDAQSTHQNSTAIGSGAQTSADNQIVLGNTQTVVKVAGIDASTAAQVGPVDVVTVDASGTLGRQRVATAQEMRTAVEYISAVTDSQFSDLSGRVAAIDTRLNGFDQRLNGIEGGVAAAMAMGQAKLVPDANISMTVAAATYGGEQGYAGSISGRLADKVYISGSMSGNTGDKRVGGAVSATFGF
nr:YadA-like family protein [Tsuneonella aeria]